jgi:hypothetical protein
MTDNRITGLNAELTANVIASAGLELPVKIFISVSRFSHPDVYLYSGARIVLRVIR